MGYFYLFVLYLSYYKISGPPKPWAFYLGEGYRIFKYEPPVRYKIGGVEFGMIGGGIYQFS